MSVKSAAQTAIFNFEHEEQSGKFSARLISKNVGYIRRKRSNALSKLRMAEWDNKMLPRCSLRASGACSVGSSRILAQLNRLNHLSYDSAGPRTMEALQEPAMIYVN